MVFLVVRNCGITTNENNTYFESDGSEVGACRLRVCKVFIWLIET
jgi:hypothetical protein